MRSDRRSNVQQKQGKYSALVLTMSILIVSPAVAQEGKSLSWFIKGKTKAQLTEQTTKQSEYRNALSDAKQLRNSTFSTPSIVAAIHSPSGGSGIGSQDTTGFEIGIEQNIRFGADSGKIQAAIDARVKARESEGQTVILEQKQHWAHIFAELCHAESIVKSSQGMLEVLKPLNPHIISAKNNGNISAISYLKWETLLVKIKKLLTNHQKIVAALSIPADDNAPTGPCVWPAPPPIENLVQESPTAKASRASIDAAIADMSITRESYEIGWGLSYEESPGEANGTVSASIRLPLGFEKSNQAEIRETQAEVTNQQMRLKSTEDAQMAEWKLLAAKHTAAQDARDLLLTLIASQRKIANRLANAARRGIHQYQDLIESWEDQFQYEMELSSKQSDIDHLLIDMLALGGRLP